MFWKLTPEADYIKKHGYKMYDVYLLCLDRFFGKNHTTHSYWIQCPETIINNDLSIILEDTIKHRLYLFNIPKGTFSRIEIDPKLEKYCLPKTRLDIVINYDDNTFTIKNTNTQLKKCLIASIDYDDLSNYGEKF